MPGPLDFTFVLCTMAPVFFLEMFAGPLSTDGFVPSGGIGSHKAEDEHSLPLSQHTRSGSATGADSAARAGSTALPSVKPISLHTHSLPPSSGNSNGNPLTKPALAAQRALSQTARQLHQAKAKHPFPVGATLLVRPTLVQQQETPPPAKGPSLLGLWAATLLLSWTRTAAAQ